jgi:hypothetical protein
MCHLVREPFVSTEPGRVETPPKVTLPRQRWLVAGAALAGSIAMAALVSPAQAPEVPKAAAPVATAARSAEPAGGAIARTALPADDDVPTASGATKARTGYCHEGM